MAINVSSFTVLYTTTLRSPHSDLSSTCEAVMIDDDAAEGLLAASSSENGQRTRGEELDGRDSRDSFVSTGSVDSASDVELSGKARCVQLAAFVVCFALTFVLDDAFINKIIIISCFNSTFNIMGYCYSSNFSFIYNF